MFTCFACVRGFINIKVGVEITGGPPYNITMKLVPQNDYFQSFGDLPSIAHCDSMFYNILQLIFDCLLTGQRKKTFKF